jgi:hypothetical protein
LFKTGGWSKFLDISNNWKAAVVFTLIMLPGVGAHKLGQKLQETAAKDELREKARLLGAAVNEHDPRDRLGHW